MIRVLRTFRPASGCMLLIPVVCLGYAKLQATFIFLPISKMFLSSVVGNWPAWQGNDLGGTIFSMPPGLASNSGEKWLPVDGCTSMNGAQYMHFLNPACNAHGKSIGTTEPYVAVHMIFDQDPATQPSLPPIQICVFTVLVHLGGTSIVKSAIQLCWIMDTESAKLLMENVNGGCSTWGMHVGVGKQLYSCIMDYGLERRLDYLE